MKQIAKAAGVAGVVATLFWVGRHLPNTQTPVAPVRHHPAGSGVSRSPADRTTNRTAAPAIEPPDEDEATDAAEAPARERSRLDTRTVVLNVRQALGCLRIARQRNGLLLKGSANCDGEVAPWTLLFNGTGCYLQDFQGAFRRTKGSDGRSRWEVASAAPHGREETPDLTLPERILGLFTGRDLTVSATLQDRRADDGSLLLTLPARSRGAVAQVAIAEESWLPRRMEWNTSGGMERWEFTDYASVANVRIPQVIVREARWGTVQYQVQGGGGAPDLGPNPYKAQVPKIAQLRPNAAGSPGPGREVDDLGEPGLHPHTLPG